MPITLKKNGRRFTAERTTDSGELTYSQSVSADNERQRRKVADELGVDAGDLIRGIGRLRAEDDLQKVDIAIPVAAERPAASFTIAIRGKKESSESATLLTRGSAAEALRDTLAATPNAADPVFSWYDGDELACLDIDYHQLPADQRPTQSYLGSLVASVLQPRPIAWHLSRGMGIHAYYVRGDRYTARELAALAGLSWVYSDRRATFDITTISRMPTHPVTFGIQCDDAPTLARWLARSVDESIVDEYLDESGFQIGKRYPHDRCPIDPNHASHGDPVYVTEQGIYCHSCSSRGLALGCRRAGWAPWTALTPGGSDPLVIRMARKWCHWEHAKIVVDSRLGLRGEIAELAYKSILKTLHDPSDPRHAGVFHAGRDMIRQRGRWTSADGSIALSKDIVAMLAKLPATQYIHDGQVKVDASIVNRFQTGLSLAEDGYPALSVIRGCRVYGQFLEPTNDDVSVVMPAESVRVAGSAFAPRYIDKSVRMPDAWDVVESVFPGINRDYLQLLIAAKGGAEGRCGKVPFLVVDGPSASAKSGTVAVAASICGDTHAEVTYTPDETRFRQGLKKAADGNGYIVVNEVMKSGRRNRLSARDALDPLLNITPESESHQLYTGSVRFGNVPPIVFTDTRVPDEVRRDIQIARRLTHVRLSRRLAWESPMVAAGVHRPGDFRTTRLDFAFAANTILSEVIDRFFVEPIPFERIAEELGFSSLEDSDEFEDDSDSLRQFFDAVCAAPPPAGSDASRWPGKGWKVLKRGNAGDLADAWDMLADDAWISSRRCEERDWSSLLNVSESVKFDCVAHGTTIVAVRFRVGNRKQPRKVNAEILGD